MTGCGECALCCKVMGVPELGKPRGLWCRHCDHQSCRIYADRPRSCRDFECLWLLSQRQPDARLPREMRPDRSRVVMTVAKDGRSLIVHVDPDRPGHWRRRKVQQIIDRFLAAGEKVIVAIGDQRILLGHPRGAIDVPTNDAVQ
jgi:hypothetical protein